MVEIASKRYTHAYHAYVPFMGGTCRLKVHGDLSVVGGKLEIETEEGTELMTVTSGNGGFKIEDRRDGTQSVLSRNGSMFFLYGKVEIGRKVPRATVKPNMVNSRACLLYTSPSPRDLSTSRMPSSA